MPIRSRETKFLSISADADAGKDVNSQVEINLEDKSKVEDAKRKRSRIDEHNCGPCKTYYPLSHNFTAMSWVAVFSWSWYVACCIKIHQADNILVKIDPLMFTLLVVLSQSLACVVTMGYFMFPRRHPLQVLLFIMLVCFCIPGDVLIIVVAPFGPLITIAGLMWVHVGWMPIMSYYMIGPADAELAGKTLWNLRFYWFCDMTAVCFDIMSDLGLALNFILQDSPIAGVSILLLCGADVLYLIYLNACFLRNIVLDSMGLAAATMEIPILVISVYAGFGKRETFDVEFQIYIGLSAGMNLVCIAKKFVTFFQMKNNLGRTFKEIWDSLTWEAIKATTVTSDAGSMANNKKRILLMQTTGIEMDKNFYDMDGMDEDMMEGARG